MASGPSIRQDAALIGNVAARELRGLSRAPWAFGLAAALVTIVGVATLAGMPRGAPASTAVALYTQRVVSIHGLALVALAVLAVPFLAIHAVHHERWNRTGDLLSLTHLRPVHLVLGKTVAILGLFTLTVIASLPLTGMVLFFSGVDLRGLVRIPLPLGFLALCCAGCGIAAGTGGQRAPTAWLYAVGNVVLLCVYPVILGHIAYWAFRKPLIPDVLYSLTPIRISLPALFGATPAAPPYPYLSLVYLLLCAALALWVAAYRWERAMRSGEASTRGIRGNAARGLFWPRKPIPYGANPVFLRERTAGGIHAATYIPTLFLLGAVWGLLSMVVHGFFPQPALPRTNIDLTRLLAVLALAPALGAHVILREHAQGTLAQLRVTCLSPHQILSGKTRVLLLGIAPLVVGLYVTSTVNGLLSDREPPLLVAVHCLVWMPIYFVYLGRWAMLGALLVPGPIHGLIAGYGFAVAGALLHFMLVSQIMLDNFGLLLSRVDANGLAIFWCIDAVFLCVLNIPVFGLACRVLQTGKRVPFE